MIHVLHMVTTTTNSMKFSTNELTPFYEVRTGTSKLLKDMPNAMESDNTQKPMLTLPSETGEYLCINVAAKA